MEAAEIRLQRWILGPWRGHSGPRWTMMLLTNRQQCSRFQREQPTHNWITRFFHAVPTRDLFAQETKARNRTFESINETISLLLIFTTWLALSSLVTTPKGLFAQKTSPHCSGNCHLNLFYSIKFLLFVYPRCGSTGTYTKQQDC